MIEDQSNFWNERFNSLEYAYGIEPNVFFKNQFPDENLGRALFPGDGEGRNSVYAAKHGWTTYSFDLSSQAKKKALDLAKKNNVKLSYKICDVPNLNFANFEYDLLALIHIHFPSALRASYHDLLIKKLKKGGLVILEAFSKEHIELRLRDFKVGGPDKIDLLYSLDEIKNDFKNFEFLILEKKEVSLCEGSYHNGLSSMIRMVAKKMY